MTVTQHTVADVFILFSAALISGIILSVTYLLLLSIPQIIQSFKCSKFTAYNSFCERVSFARKSGKLTVIFDITMSILFAMSLSLVSFWFNSGNFRLSSVAFMLIGFALGYCLLEKIVQSLLVNCMFLLKLVIDILLYPFLWGAIKVSSLIYMVFQKVNAHRIDRLIEKHTKERFSRIEKDTELGLIDKFYKELKNERTV